MTTKLVPASKYTIEELTEIYNQTRVDYLVPMPMNAARLQEYVHLYDVDLEQSIVALDDDIEVGLGMLGVRDNRSWITRLGLVANQRKKGVGRVLTEGLIQNSDELGIDLIQLEVIVGNEPARNLFEKLGFEPQRELLILRRPPTEVAEIQHHITDLSHDECIERLSERTDAIAWTNQTESMEKAKGIAGFEVHTKDGSYGWLIYQKTLFYLSRLMFCTANGDPVEIIQELIKHLHTIHPNLDTQTENIPALDPHMPGLAAQGYLESFRRTEMYRFRPK